MPLTVSWPPSRNHPLPLFLLFLLFPILFLSRLYSTVNHNAFRTRLYRILRIKCRNSLSALSTRFSLDPCLSLSLSRLVRTFKYEGRRIKGRTPRGLLRKIGKDTQHRTVCYIYSRNDPWLFFSSEKGEKISPEWKKSFPSSSRKPIEYTGSVWIDWRVASLNSRFKKYTRYSKIISRKDKKRSIEKEERKKRRISIPRQSEIHGV